MRPLLQYKGHRGRRQVLHSADRLAVRSILARSAHALCITYGRHRYPHETATGPKEWLDPNSLVEYALGKLKKDSDFNHVFCVFDRDKHRTDDAVVDKIRSKRLKGGTKLHPIISFQCFEVWILLHLTYTYTTAPFQAAADDSNRALVVGELHREGRIPGYGKGIANVFDLTIANIDTAILRAKQLVQFQLTSEVDNPSTKMYQLVEHLRAMNR